MDESVVSQIRDIQASKITSSSGSVSFSRVVNQILKDALNANGVYNPSLELSHNQNKITTYKR